MTNPVAFRNDSFFLKKTVNSTKFYSVENLKSQILLTLSWRRPLSYRNQSIKSAMSYRRLIDVETTSCVYWVVNAFIEGKYVNPNFVTYRTFTNDGHKYNIDMPTPVHRT